jgi:hypothetical protein
MTPQETNNINSTLGIADPKANIIRMAEGVKKTIARLKAAGQDTSKAEEQLGYLRRLYRGEKVSGEADKRVHRSEFTFNPKVGTWEEFKKRSGISFN